MALNIHKPIDNPQHISILMPTRGRSHTLKNVFDSLEDATKDKSLVDLWIYVDDDDIETIKFIKDFSMDRYGFKVNFVVASRTTTHGEMCNVLRERCATNPGIFMPAADDYIFATKDWDEMVRDVFNAYPDRILLADLVDPTVPSGQVTHTILSAEWTNVLGRFSTEYFPFWYDDYWLDQVSQMIQRKIRLNMKMAPQGGKGKTSRMKDILFWQKFYVNTQDERIKDADMLRKKIYPENSAKYNKSVEKGNEVIKRHISEYKRTKDDDLISMEKRFSDGLKNPNFQINRIYLNAKMNAIDHLCKKLSLSIEQGSEKGSLSIWNNLILANRKTSERRYRYITLKVAWKGRFGRVWSKVCALFRALKNPAKYPAYAKHVFNSLFSLVKK